MSDAILEPEQNRRSATLQQSGHGARIQQHGLWGDTPSDQIAITPNQQEAATRIFQAAAVPIMVAAQSVRTV